MASAPGPVEPAAAAQAAMAPGFNAVDYLRRLRLASVEVKRIRSKTSPPGINAIKDAMQMLAELVSHGMAEAKTVTPKADRDDFIDEMRKIIASSGMPLASKPQSSHAAPAKVSGALTTRDANEMYFADRLPRFMKKWEEGDPEWRLLQCAIRMVDDQTFIIGMAETSLQHYSVFHGVSGGEYKTKEMALLDAQKMLTAAYQRGYTAIPVKAVAATMNPTKVANTQYSVVRMTSAAPAAALPTTDPSASAR